MNMIVSGIYIELLSNCNLRCLHCYNNSGETVKMLDMPSLERIAKYVSKNNVNGISISGGEPLLYSNIIDIINLFFESGVSNISIITNATLVSEKLMEEFKQKNLLNKISFQVSVDGATPEQHDHVRGNGAFLKLERGLDILKKYNARYFFHCVLHKANHMFVDEIIDFANRIHKTRVDFALLKKKGRGVENFQDISLNPQEQIDVILKLKQKTDTANFNSPSVFYGSCPIFSDENAETFIRIDYDGNVYPCQNFSYPGSALGNIKQEDLDVIVADQRVKLVSDRIKEFREKYSNCSTCALSSYCKLGCPGVDYCEEFKNEMSDDCILRRAFFKKMLIESKVANYVKT